MDSAADEGLSRRRLDEAAFRRFVDDVKARTDLVALVGRDLDLKPSGSVLKASSPTHRDTDPSFVVFPHTQTWHDFSGGGSGGGDCLDYLVLNSSVDRRIYNMSPFEDSLVKRSCYLWART